MILMLAVASVLATVASARAQDASAEVLFRDGDRLMAEGKLTAACTAFEASNRVEARAGTLIRLGDCREKNGQLASAWSAYADAESRAKDPTKQKVAAAKVRRLEPRLSRLTISVATPVAALVIHRDRIAIDPALWSRALPIDGGAYVIRATADGFAPWQATVAVPDQDGVVTVVVPALRALPRAATLPRSARDRTDAPPASSERSRRLSGKRKAAIGLGAGGVAVLGAAIALGVQARGLEGDAARLCPAVMCARAGEANDLLDRASTRARFANLGYGLGGAALAGAAILWLVGGSSATQPGVAIVPSGAGAAVIGRF